MFRLWRRGQGQ